MFGLFFTSVVFGLICCGAATTCKSPSASSSYLVVNDAVFHFSSACVVEFVLNCQNDAKELSLFAEVNGRILPVAISEASNRYQVSWSEDHEKFLAGTYKVNIHDEDGIAAIKRAQRNNEDISKVKPLAQVDVVHKGPVKAPWVQTPVLAFIICALIWYYAYSSKSTIQS